MTPFRRRSESRGILHSLLLLVLSLSATAAADEELVAMSAVEGVVVRVDDAELVIDIGRDRGLSSEAVVQLYRRVELTHPVSGDVLVDRFPIGGVELDEVGDILSIVRDFHQLERFPAVGDLVVYEPVPVLPSMATPPTPDVVDDPEQAAADLAFLEALGRPLNERIRIWGQFLQEYPSSPYTELVGAELAWLRRELAVARSVAAPPVDPLFGSGPLQAYVSAPQQVYTDEPVSVVVAVVDRERVDEVRLLMRRAGEPGYDTLAMRPDGDFSWRADLGELEAGTVEYFVEAVRVDGNLELLDGSAGLPLDIRAELPDRDEVQHDGRSRARVVFEYVDFNIGQAVDQYLRFEADYQYRLNTWIFRSFAVGVGVFQGEGASLEEIDAGEPSQPQSANYGFAELEFEFVPRFAVRWRFLAGNSHREGVDDSLSGFFGYQLVLRIGEADRTRLELGGALADNLGNQAWAELLIETIERWPMDASVVVTSLPVGEDLGVRLSYGVGYRVAEWLTLYARTGINARTVDTWGLTAGLGTQMSW